VRLADTACNTLLWLLVRACPLLGTRSPDWMGPHCMARIAVCPLLEGVFVTFAALILPSNDVVLVKATAATM
jgi:hypothetical protein